MYNPLNEPRNPLGRDVFLFNSIECPLLKTFENITLKKITFHPKNYKKKF